MHWPSTEAAESNVCVPSPDGRPGGKIQPDINIHVGQDGTRRWSRLGYETALCVVCLLSMLPQINTGIPFYLLYGRDPRLPSPAALNPQTTRSTQNLKEYGLELHAQLSETWETARKYIGRAQKRQKATYDRKWQPARFQAGERCFSSNLQRSLGRAESLQGLSTAHTESWRWITTLPRSIELTSHNGTDSRCHRPPAKLPGRGSGWLLAFWPSSGKG